MNKKQLIFLLVILGIPLLFGLYYDFVNTVLILGFSAIGGTIIIGILRLLE